MVKEITPQSERDSEQTPGAQTGTEESVVESTCPECEGQIIHNAEHGEKTCEDCGLVLHQDAIDHGPEWRAYHDEESKEKRRVGAPTTQLLHDQGLSTTISWQNKDAYGQTIAAQKQARLQRLRTWDERFRTKDAHERNIKQALGEINRMGAALDLPEPVREAAAVLYRRAVEENLLPGRSIEGMSTASLYGAARQQGAPRPISKFAAVSRVEKTRIQRAYRYLSRELGLTIEPELPVQYLPQLASALDVSDEARRLSREILEAGEKAALYSGKSPAGLAAAALYAASRLTNEQLTQQTVSNAAHVSKVTIRNRYQELLDVYGCQK